MYKFTLAMRVLLDDINVMMQLQNLCLNMKNGNNLQHRDPNHFQRTDRKAQEVRAPQTAVYDWVSCLGTSGEPTKNINFLPQALVSQKKEAGQCSGDNTSATQKSSEQNPLYFSLIFYIIFKGYFPFTVIAKYWV